MRSTALKKTAVVFQITAIVLLQLYAVVPLIFKTFTAHAGSIKCVGDHKKCGCSPFKVSSQTCCCFKSGQIAKTSFSTDDYDFKSALNDSPAADKQISCCAGMNSEETTAFQDKTDITIPEMKPSSCCGDPDQIFLSLEKSKFIRQQLYNKPPQLSSFVKYHQISASHERFLEPPVPPPQLSKFT